MNIFQIIRRKVLYAATVLRLRNFFVILDPADNSCTLSKALFDHMRNHSDPDVEPKVFVFRVSGSFGFMLNPDIDQPTQLCQIQYNGKYQCIGFETLCPSVGQMLYDFRLPHYLKCKMSVSVEHTADGKLYYLLHAPVHPLIPHNHGRRND